MPQDVTEWFNTAREMYPDASEADLQDAYKSVYGSESLTPEPKTTDYFEEWDANAAEMYPDSTPEERRQSFVDAYGEPVEPPGLWDDTISLLKSGAFSTAQHFREVMSYVLPESVVSAIDSVDGLMYGQKSPEYLQGKVDEANQALSKEMRQSISKDWWDSDKGEFGDAITDWRSIYGAVAQSLPETVATMLPSMMVAKGIFAATLASGAKSGLSKVAAREAATKSATNAAMVTGSISEGLLAGGSASMSVRKNILGMTEEQLSKSEYFDRYRNEQGLSFEEARSKLANDQAGTAMLLGSVATGMFSGFGDRFLAKGMLGGIDKKLLGRMGLGAVSEGVFEELPQSTLSKMAENFAMQGADPSKSLTEGAINEGVGGLVAGGVMGAGFGAMTNSETARAEAIRRQQDAVQKLRDRLEAEMAAAKNADDAVNIARQMANLPTVTSDADLYTTSDNVTGGEQQILDSIFRKEQPLTTSELNDLEIARSEIDPNLPDYKQTTAIPTKIEGKVDNLVSEQPETTMRAARETLFPDEIRPRSGHYTSQVQAEQALANKRTTRDQAKQKELESFRPVEDPNVNGQWVLKRLTPQEIANEQKIQAETTAAEEAAGAAEAVAAKLTFAQAISRLRKNNGWGMRRAGEALKTITPISGTGSLAKFDSGTVDALTESDVKLSPRLPKEASFEASLAKIQDATGWTKRKAVSALKAITPVSGTGSLAMYRGSEVGKLATSLGKTAAAERGKAKADLLKVDIPEPSSKRLTIPYGQVEKAIEAKIKSVGGDLGKLTTGRLKSIPSSPTPRQSGRLKKSDFIPGDAPKRILSNRELDKNVKPRSYTDLRKMLEWSMASDDGQGTRWYKQFGEGLQKIVGKANMYEAAAIFGVTSAKNPAEANLANTLHIMALARKFDPVKDPEGFKKAVMTIKRPDGEGLFMGGPNVDRIIAMYQSGKYEGGLNISTYMQDVAAGAENTFAPFSVQDVHMARVFGYLRQDYANYSYSKKEKAAAEKAGKKLPTKKTSKVVDSAMFPGDDGKAIRYAQILTGLLADEYGIKPHEAQALLWFYAKKNLSPKDLDSKKGKTPIGDGTWSSAEEYSQKEIKVIKDMVANGTFDQNSPLNDNLIDTEIPRKDFKIKGDRWSNADFNDQLLELARLRAPRSVVSFNPGNARGYGFPAETTLEELAEYHRSVLRAITDEDGQIRFLREMGIVHEIRMVLGTWERLEPSLELTLPGETAETAAWVADILAHASMQDAAITVVPEWEGHSFGVDVRKSDGKPFTVKEISDLYDKVNPEHRGYGGLNFTTSPDMTSLKFVDQRYYDQAYNDVTLGEFYDNIHEIVGDLGYTYGTFTQNGEYIDHSEKNRGTDEKASRRYSPPTRDAYPSEGSSRIQRAAADLLYKPIWRVYKYFTGRKGYQPSNQRTPLQELRRSPRFSARLLSDGQPATKEGRVTPAADRISERLGLPPGTYREVAVPESLSGFVSDFVEKILGKKAIFVDGPEHFNGVTISPTEFAVHITSDAPHMAIIGHELLHTIRASDPKVYDDLKRALIPLLEDYSNYKEFVNKPRTDLSFPGVTDDTLVEELIADMVGDSFMDDTFWQRVQLTNPSVFERILTAVKQYMDSLVNFMRGTTLEGTKYFRDYEKARNKVADVLSSHIADRGTTQSLNWIKLSQTVTIQGTGRTATVTQSADAALKAADDRLVSLEKLARCLSA